MNTPQRFLILWAMGVVLSMLIVQSSFKTFPKYYHAAAALLIKPNITKIEPSLSFAQWHEKYGKLIQKQVQDQQQMELHMQGSFSDLTQSLQDLPAGQLLSADIHREATDLVLDLIIQKP
jgi:hypothetical protein